MVGCMEWISNMVGWTISRWVDDDDDDVQICMDDLWMVLKVLSMKIHEHKEVMRLNHD
jgi:hypothetical protein